MSDSAAEAALQDLLLRMQQKRDAEEKAAAKKNLDEQAQFLAKNILDSTSEDDPEGSPVQGYYERSGAYSQGIGQGPGALRGCPA
jgi:Domain amino terminal to FKBP-type peptidyl-prolyl isomerase.